MKLDAIVQPLHPRQPFRIARPRSTGFDNVILRLQGDGSTGYGEASPNPFYQESAQSVLEKLRPLGPAIADLRITTPADIATAWTTFWPLLAPSRAAQCALDLALWDWLAQQEAVSVSELVWGEPARPVPTFCTIGLSSPAELEEKISALRGFPLIKLKSDASADLSPLRALREASPARIAIDANGAWGDHDLPALVHQMKGFALEFLEQPLAPHLDSQLRTLPHDLPIFADESCVHEADIEALVGKFSGFNIKLVKCGGLTPALRMVRRGPELGLQTMVGCMLESSALIAAGAVIAQRTNYADLDGAWLLRDDPFTGWTFSEGILDPPTIPGLGLTEKFPLFEPPKIS